MTVNIEGLQTPSIAEVVGTFLDEKGERFYKLRWKETWESESKLDEWHVLIEEFWERNPFLSKVAEVEPGAKQECVIEDKLDVAYSRTNDGGCDMLTAAHRKRNSQSSLESIVSKLKKSRRSDSNDGGDKEFRICSDANGGITASKTTSFLNCRAPPGGDSSMTVYDACSFGSLVSDRCKVLTQRTWVPPVGRGFFAGRSYALHPSRALAPHSMDRCRGSSLDRNRESRDVVSPSSCASSDSEESSSLMSQLEEKDHSVYHGCVNGVKRAAGLKPASPNKTTSGGSESLHSRQEVGSSIVHHFPAEDQLSSSIQKRLRTSPLSQVRQDASFMSNLFAPLARTCVRPEFCPSPTRAPEEQANVLDMSEGSSVDDLYPRGLDPSKDKIDPTSCKKCSKVFYRMSQLHRHVANHVVHECEHCKALFYSLKDLKGHIKRNHECYPCEFCNELFYDASSWYQHRAKHTMLDCPSCDMIFYNKTALLKHRMEHMLYVCLVCGMEHDQYNSWASHRLHHVTSPRQMAQPHYVCSVCRDAAKTQEAFFRHDCSYERRKAIGHQLALRNRLTEPTPLDKFDT